MVDVKRYVVGMNDDTDPTAKSIQYAGYIKYNEIESAAPALKCDAILGRAVATTLVSSCDTIVQRTKPQRMGKATRAGRRFVWSVSSIVFDR